MDNFDERFTKMVVDSILEEPAPSKQLADPGASFAGNDMLFCADLPLDFSFDGELCMDDFSDFFADVSPGTSSASAATCCGEKRRPASPELSIPQKRTKPVIVDTGLSPYGVSSPDAVPSLACDDVLAGDSWRAGSVDSSEDSCAPFGEVASPSENSAEFHFEQIRRHAKLAVAALRRGNYEKTKNIVTWAHDLKNKAAHEVKKAAEQAWEADRERDLTSSPKIPAKKPLQRSTKRVEQFRKNMRRWMTGTQGHHVGVEWMVYARMEHLQTIAKYILGDALPADPANPDAVAESVNSYLGEELPLEFIDAELAEPEPGKRYAIGQRLVPHLNARLSRKVPTLAFTMPPDGQDTALEAWLTGLRALFPKKPAPKPRTFVV